MNDFIKKTNVIFNVDLLRHELQLILGGLSSWEPNNQIGLRHRTGATDVWKDGTGWTHDTVRNAKLASEEDFSEWNALTPPYMMEVLNSVSKNEAVSFGRVRLMRLMPKTGLSVHKDDGFRYHMALDTNPNSMFAECFENADHRAVCYHIPADGHVYRVDVSKYHFVYNGGFSPRVHLVACAL